MVPSRLIPLLTLLLTPGCASLRPHQALLRPHEALLRPHESQREYADRKWRALTSEQLAPEEPAFGCVTGRVASAGFLGQPLGGLEVVAYERERRAGLGHTTPDGTFKLCMPREPRPWSVQLAEVLLKALLGLGQTPTSYRDRRFDLRLEVRAAGFAPWVHALTWNTGTKGHFEVVLEPVGTTTLDSAHERGRSSPSLASTPR